MNRQSTQHMRAITLGLLLSWLLLAASPAYANTHPASIRAAAAPLLQTSCTLPATVTTANQLRDCITAANNNGAALDTITLGADITLTSALPQITTAITLEGAGYAIDGGNSIQLFNVGTAGDLTVKEATLQNGFATSGGAVYNDGTLTLMNSTLSGNTATINGGAVYNDGRLTLNNSTLSANTATNGGAIYNVIQSTVTATNSTFSGNIATNHGAAVYNYSGATVTATNSTFSGNLATNSGGGVYNRGRLTLTGGTFAGNSATTSGSIYSDSTGILHLAGNLFAAAAGASSTNCSSIGTFNDNGYNLSDDATCTNGGVGSLTNATLSLGALTDNGGLTRTHLPGAGSDAIGAIPYGTTISNNGTSWTCDQSVADQRGEPRPINSGDGCTAGAVEVPLCPSWTATTAAELYQCILKANGNESPSPTADTITLNANITLSTALPQITSEITLEGANHVIDGGNSVQLFYVDVGGDFTVNQATLQNGSANDASDINGDGINGGGINNNGKLTVTNSTISGNTAVASGGGIFNGAYGTLAVANSTISGNTATGDTATATPGYGGGIYSFNATVTLTNSTISNNTAAGGGGIYLNRGTATVTTSTISGNSATNSGGGININSYGTVAVTNSTISGNSAANGGGINNSGTATVTDSTISDNTATGGGGGIDNDSTLAVTNSTISGNTVTGTGDGGGINNSGTATVTDSTLHSNTANRRGGGINNSGTLTVTTSTFSGNSATTRGGGIYNNGGTVTVTTSTFYRNSATAIGVGGVYNNGGTVHLAGVILDNGTSGANCSASITDNGYNLSDDASCGFSGTSANMVSLNLSALSVTTTPGQQVHTPQTGSDAIGAIPNGTSINNNGVTLACNQTATDQLGADRPITAFTACTAGAVEVTMPPICTSWTVTTADELSDCITLANGNESPSPTADTITLGADIDLTTLTTSPLPRITSAITLEGAGYAVDGGNSVQLFYVNSGGDFTVNQATLQNGSATSGGGIRNYGTVTVINSTISGNTADTDGGGIDNYNGTLTVTNSTISGNSAGEFGGGIGNGGTLTVTNSTISGNTAGSGGGIDHVWGTTTVTNSTISGNTATGSGGGILNANGMVTVTNSTISGNTATNGGGIANLNSTVTVSNSTFSGNSATSTGGGIYNDTGTVTVTNSTFSGNTATGSGGGIYNDTGTVKVTNSTFSRNSAFINGGGIYNGTGTVHLAGTIFAVGPKGNNCANFGTLNDNGYNLSDDASCGFTGTGSADNATLNLSALSGTTTPGQQVHTPQVGSDAIGVIPNGTSINNNGVTLACNGTTTDQLGTDRPITIGTACTSGAVEVAVYICPASWTVATAGELSACITLANNNESPSPTADTITLGANITLSTALPRIASEITLEGAGYAVDGGDSVQLFSVTSGGDFTVNQATLQNGSATFGGGIYNDGTLTVTNSTFSSNSVTYGGGIYNHEDGTAMVSNSTFSSNFANYGGGIYNYGTLTVANSTFSSNSAAIWGGGIYHNYTGMMIMTNSTVSGNRASDGGGIFNNSGTVHLAGTILANGTSGANCDGPPSTTFTDNGYNLSDDASCGFSGISADNATLNLGALTGSGSGQQVHVPQTGSDAIGVIPNGTTINNNGVTLACNSTTTDQLGADRPINIGTACTSGAVEVASPVASLTIVKDAEPADGTDFSFVMTPAGLAEPTYLLKWGSDGTGNGQFDHPWGVAVDGAGNVYVADGWNRRIQKFDSSGAYLLQWGSSGIGNGQFIEPVGVAVDGTGNVYVTDIGNHRIQKFDSNGTYLTQWGSNGSGDGQFDTPYGVAVDGAGNVYVVENWNHRIQKFDSNGTYLTQWGSFGSGNGQFRRPTGLTVDGSGNVYVADRDNHRIQKFDSNGTYLTQWGSLGSGDGQFNLPFGVAVNGSGSVYVVDNNNDRIQKFSTSQFTLDDALPDDNDGISNTITFAGLSAGSYSFTETLPLDWHLAAIGCDSGSWTADVSNAALTVNLSAGQNITCTFSNVEPTQPGPDFVVNTAADTDDGYCDLLGQGLGNQDCTLREAINAANGNADASTITFGGDYSIRLTFALPTITTEMTIDGVGHSVTISSNSTAFQVLWVAPTGNLAIDALTITNGGGSVNEGSMTVSNSTFSDNISDGAAGIENYGTLTVTNSTFSGNHTFYSGGGIYNDSGTLMVTNSTFSGNSSVDSGGGIYNRFGTMYLAGTIFADNFGGNCFNNGGTFIDNGYNLSDDASCGFSGTGSANNATLALGALADNGGPTLTHLPGAGSDAIGSIPSGTTISNNGASWTCDQSATDQRGESRPINSGEACTVGAVEVARVQLTLQPNGYFSWLPDHGGSCSESLYRSSTPYVGHTWLTDDPANYDGSGSLTSVAINYFYYLLVDCGGSLSQSNEVGEFTFAIVPGG